MSKTTSRAVATAADASLFAHANLGLPADIGSEDYAIPFLSVLQKGSPQVDETSGVALDGARAGMLYENVQNKLFDGKSGVLAVPVAYRHMFVRWGPRSGEGAGFKGELAVETAAAMRDNGQVKELDGRLYFPMPDGSVNEKRSDRLSDTRNWYLLVLDEASGGWTTALLSLTSTQIKKSKMLMSMLQSVRLRTPEGAMARPAMFYNIVRITTTPESNDKGSWFGVRFELAGNTAGRADLHAEAIAFAESVRAGSVTARYEETPPAAQDAAF
jgi:hypothetical protein